MVSIAVSAFLMVDFQGNITMIRRFETSPSISNCKGNIMNT